MMKHPHTEGFLTAVNAEYTTLLDRGAFKVVPESDVVGFVIPTRFVFKYKLDKDSYLLKYKARLVVRSNLQPKN